MQCNLIIITGNDYYYIFTISYILFGNIDIHIKQPDGLSIFQEYLDLMHHITQSEV